MTIAIGKDTENNSHTVTPVVTHARVDNPPKGLQTLTDQIAGDLVALFKLLADETRLRVLFLLRQRNELNVQTLCRLLGQSQPAVSHHLALLREAGLIKMRRDGKHNFYRLMPKRFEELVGMLFAVSPNEKNQIRFDDYVLSYSHA
jgi:ArsR family transcriptional regulator